MEPGEPCGLLHQGGAYDGGASQDVAEQVAVPQTLAIALSHHVGVAGQEFSSNGEEKGSRGGVDESHRRPWTNHSQSWECRDESLNMEDDLLISPGSQL